MRILLPFCRAAASALPFYRHFHAGIADAAQALGHAVSRFDFDTVGQVAPAETDALYRQLIAQEPDLVLDLCCWGHALSRSSVWDGSEEGQAMFDAFDACYVGWLFDQAYLQPLSMLRSARLYAAVPDEFHAEQIALVYPEVELRGMVLAPPAIRAADDRSSQAWSERDIGALYIGNVHPEALTRLWRADADAALFDATADNALARPEQPLHRSLQQAAEALGKELTPARALDILRPVEYFLRARYRLDLVQTVAGAGVRLCVVGQGWSNLALPDNVTLLPPTDYDGLFQLMGRAKIYLDNSTYIGGANDRVFSASVNGTLCLTNARRYLSQSYGEDSGMDYYSVQHLHEVPEMLGSSLAADKLSAERGRRSRDITLALHTWRNRLQEILLAVAERR